MTRPLPPADQARLEALFTRIGEARKGGDTALMERLALEAWDAIPEPKVEYDDGQILAGGLVQLYRDTKHFAKAREWARTMASSYPDPTDPHVRFTVGTVAFEEGCLDEAFEIFDAVYRADGRRPFQGKEPKYLDLVLSRRGTVSVGQSSKRGSQELSWAAEAAEPPPVPAELPGKVHRQIEKLGKKGDALAEKGKYARAIEVYREGIDLLPRPKAHWDAATWLLAAIADAQFFAGEFAAAVQTLEDAKFCPSAIGNPFIHLRLGQCLLETGQRDRALDELARAYMGGGRQLFEDQDPKYLAELGKVLKPPPGQDSL